MAMCSKNLSIGIYAWAPAEFLDIKNNVITGYMGAHYDKWIVHRGKRNCKLKPIYFFKEAEDRNESMKVFGADYMMKKNLLDFYSRPKTIGYIRSHLEMSKTASIDS